MFMEKICLQQHSNLDEAAAEAGHQKSSRYGRADDFQCKNFLVVAVLRCGASGIACGLSGATVCWIRYLSPLIELVASFNSVLRKRTLQVLLQLIAKAGALTSSQLSDLLPTNEEQSNPAS